MSEKNEKKYLTVGAFARLSGVSVKSLRYYDTIGALKPSYVSAETGYRYYTYDQLHLLEAVRLCIELDIPLSGFSEFVDERGRLLYARLIERGRELALRKMKAISADLEYLADMGRIVERGEAYARGAGRQEFVDRERLVWLVPYDDCDDYDNVYEQSLKMMSEIIDAGLEFGYEVGIMFIKRGGTLKRYYYCALMDTDSVDEFPNIMRVPELKQSGIIMSTSSINRADELFKGQTFGDCFITQIEIPTGNYDYSSPLFELRIGTAKE